MIYEPKIVFNPTDKVVEVMCDRQVYVFQPGEKKLLEGFVAYHALTEVNTGLKEYEQGDEVSTSNIAYDKIPWTKLVSLAGGRGIRTVGKTRKELIKLLVELDGQETGAVRGSTKQEETTGA